MRGCGVRSMLGIPPSPWLAACCIVSYQTRGTEAVVAAVTANDVTLGTSPASPDDVGTILGLLAEYVMPTLAGNDPYVMWATQNDDFFALFNCRSAAMVSQPQCIAAGPGAQWSAYVSSQVRGGVRCAVCAEPGRVLVCPRAMRCC